MMMFDVIVQRDDGRRLRYDVPHKSRSLAARLGEELAFAAERIPARSELVNLVLSRVEHDRGETPDEALGPVEHLLQVADRRGVIHSKSTRARTRWEAIRQFEPVGTQNRVVALKTVFRCVGHCATCRATLFDDIPIRQSARGNWKCLECD